MQNFDRIKISKRNAGITFQIKAIPNSSISKIIEITEEYVKIKLNSPPIENKANKEAVEILSKSFNVPKSSIILLVGDKTKLKTFYLPIDENVFRNKLEKL